MQSTVRENTLRNVKRNNSPAKAVVRRIWSNKGARFGVIIIAILAIGAIFANKIAPYGYEDMNILEAFSAPSLKHLCGTDNLGRDIFSRLLYGARYSMTIGFAAVGIGLLGGTILGAISGFFGGTVDIVIMRILDIIQAIPQMLMAILISTVLGAGFFNTVLALAFGSICNFARMLRANMLGSRNSDYVEAAMCINCSYFRTIFHHVLPNCFSPLLVSATMTVGGMILGAAGLSFIGLGIKPPNPEWGAMLSAGRKYIRTAPYMIIIPGILIALAVLAYNLIGDAIRDALDPKLKN